MGSGGTHGGAQSLAQSLARLPRRSNDSAGSATGNGTAAAPAAQPPGNARPPRTRGAANPPHDCPLCPRLVALRAECRAEHPDWWNAPVPAFGDAQVHVEWATPAPPTGDGQKRGNSGVFLMGLYEVQVLDSIGKPLHSENMGAIYSRITPAVADFGRVKRALLAALSPRR